MIRIHIVACLVVLTLVTITNTVEAVTFSKVKISNHTPDNLTVEMTVKDWCWDWVQKDKTFIVDPQKDIEEDLWWTVPWYDANEPNKRITVCIRRTSHFIKYALVDFTHDGSSLGLRSSLNADSDDDLINNWDKWNSSFFSVSHSNKHWWLHNTYSNGTVSIGFAE